MLLFLNYGDVGNVTKWLTFKSSFLKGSKSIKLKPDLLRIY